LVDTAIAEAFDLRPLFVFRKIQLPIFSPLYFSNVTLMDICKSVNFVFVPVVPSSHFRNVQISTPSLLCGGGVY
jgi:Cu/Ag efflux pump CusA